MIANLTLGSLTIDCAQAESSRDFYAHFMGWEKTVNSHFPALTTTSGLLILFATTLSYAPPVWPEEPGEQQKQMHLDFTVEEIPSAVAKAISLGATKAVAQYGGEQFITMLDPEGRPFCLCQGQPSEEGSQFTTVSINIDCPRYETLREFYAALTPWDQNFHYTTLVPENKMVVHFMGCEGDFVYLPPVYPSEPGKQQKQMHLTFYVDDLPSAVAEVLRLGGSKVPQQDDNELYIMMLDTEGHPFALQSRSP